MFEDLIREVDKIASVLGIDFPQSANDFNVRDYALFKSMYWNEYMYTLRLENDEAELEYLLTIREK